MAVRGRDGAGAPKTGDGRMIGRMALAGALGCGLLFASRGSAVTPEEDEARIEVLVKAEREAAQPAAAPPANADAAAVPVVAVVTANAPTARGGNDDWLASAEPQGTGVAFADLAQHIGRRVSVATRGEHTHRGIVSSADARQLTLRVRRSGGNATYTLRRDQVVRIDLL